MTRDQATHIALGARHVRAKEAKPAYHSSARPGLTLATLPDQVVRIIVEFVGTVEEPFDPEDRAFTTPDMYMDKVSLCQLSRTSRTMHTRAMRLVWRRFDLFSPSSMLLLAKAVLEQGYGNYIRTIIWRQSDEYFQVSIVRAILRLLEQNNATKRDAGLTGCIPLVKQWTRAALQEPASTDSRELPKSDELPFTAQLIAILLPRIPALSSLTLSLAAVGAIGRLAPEALDLSQLAILSIKDGIVKSRRKGDLDSKCLAPLIQATFGPMRDLLVLDASNVRSSGCRLGLSQPHWHRLRSLSIDYHDITASDDSADAAVDKWQRLCDSLPKLISLRLNKPGMTSRGLYSGPILSRVRFPPTLQNIHINGLTSPASGQNIADQGDFLQGLEHCDSLKYLRLCYRFGCSYDAKSNWAPAILPPSLTTLKIILPEAQYGKPAPPIKPTPYSLLYRLVNGQYPETLSCICVASGYIDAIFQWWMDSAPGIEQSRYLQGLPDVEETLISILRLDEACRGRRVKLCGHYSSVPLVPPGFYSTLSEDFIRRNDIIVPS